MRRKLLTLLAMALMVVMMLAAAVPALAAKPDTDAKGCNNTKASQLDSYCKDDTDQ